MTPEVKALHERHDALQAEAKPLLAGLNTGSIAIDGVERLKAINAEVNEITGKIRQSSELSGITTNLSNAAQFLNSGSGGAQILGFLDNPNDPAAYVQRGTREILHADEELTPLMRQMKRVGEVDYKQAFRQYLRKSGSLGSMGMTHAKVIQEGIDTSGGFLVPEEMLNRIVMKKPTPTRVAGRVTRLTTSRDDLTLPKVNYTTDDLYTTGARVTWTGEQPAAATTHLTTDPAFGQIKIPVHTAMISLLVSRDMLEDSMVNMIEFIGARFAETYDLLQDNMVLNGTGVTQPAGILSSPAGTNRPGIVNSGSASALTADGIINLAETLPEQYEDGAVYVFNKTNTSKAMRILKDGEGRYLFARTADGAPGSLVAGRPTECNGYPYIFTGFMPNVGTNTYPIIFGNLAAYYLVERVSMSIQVLNEIYAPLNQALVLGRLRFGGDVAEDWALKIQKCSA